MSHDKFDFQQAERLIEAVNSSASQIDVKNGQMEKRFGDLREYFKDSGYDDFAGDMSAANKAIADIIQQLHEISKHIASYAERLRQEV